jgi:GxxExxY protein
MGYSTLQPKSIVGNVSMTMDQPIGLTIDHGESQPRLLEGDTTGVILDSFREVHRTLGFGYREYIYSRAMERELRSRGATVEREVMVMVYYKGEPLAGQTVDMLVNGKVMVENKAKEKMPPGTTEQLFSYLCATDFEVGLVLNFGRVADFHRVICENRSKQRNGPKP